MKKRIVFTRHAEQELTAAAAWYEREQEGLGAEFAGEIDEALERIAAKPSASPLWRDDRRYRKGGVKRFPYILFFVETEDTFASSRSPTSAENPDTGWPVSTTKNPASV